MLASLVLVRLLTRLVLALRMLEKPLVAVTSSGSASCAGNPESPHIDREEMELSTYEAMRKRYRVTAPEGAQYHSLQLKENGLLC